MYSEKNLDQQHEWQFTKPSSAVLCNRAIFGQVSGKHSRIDLVLLYFAVIGPKNSRHSINQSDSKVNLVSTWSVAFSRASNYLLDYTLSLHWFLVIFSFPLIGTEWRSRSRTVLQQIISKHQSMCLCNLTVVSSAILNCYAVVLLLDSQFPVLRPSFSVPRSKFQKHLFYSNITPREGSISSDLPCRQKERLKLLETTQITT